MAKTEINKKTVKGYGIVGTWRAPYDSDGTLPLGGALPQWLCKSQVGAKGEANGNQRLFYFLDETEQWLCEITIKPIKRVKPRKMFDVI